MLVSHDEREPIARLLTFLEYGERMAHECAKAQAALAEDSGTRRFLLSQANQKRCMRGSFKEPLPGLPRSTCVMRRFFQPWKSIAGFWTMLWPGMTFWKHFWPSKWSSKA